jgi:hypothetical protein
MGGPHKSRQTQPESLTWVKSTYERAALHKDPRRLHSRLDLLVRQQVPILIQIPALADAQEAAVAASALGFVEGFVGEEDQLGGGLNERGRALGIGADQLPS